MPSSIIFLTFASKWRWRLTPANLLLAQRERRTIRERWRERVATTQDLVSIRGCPTEIMTAFWFHSYFSDKETQTETKGHQMEGRRCGSGGQGCHEAPSQCITPFSGYSANLCYCLCFVYSSHVPSLVFHTQDFYFCHLCLVLTCSYLYIITLPK